MQLLCPGDKTVDLYPTIHRLLIQYERRIINPGNYSP
jgi:hypothetical protein